MENAGKSNAPGGRPTQTHYVTKQNRIKPKKIKERNTLKAKTEGSIPIVHKTA